MRRLVVFALFVLVGAGGILAITLASKGPRTAPDFVLPDLDRQTVRLRDLRGKVVVLNVWATWCPPCVEEMPTLEALHRKMQGRDFVVLAVSEDQDVALVSPWVRSRGLTLPVLLDPLGQVAHDYGLTGYPETFVIDREGRIVEHHVGYRDWADPLLVAKLDDLMRTGRWSD